MPSFALKQMKGTYFTTYAVLRAESCVEKFGHIVVGGI